MKHKNITDTQLVEYILKIIPKKDEKIIADILENNYEEKERFFFWQEALFKLTKQIKPIQPPKRVWGNIEKDLFEDKSNNKITNSKISFPFWKSLVTGCSVLIIAFFVFFSQKHNYTATIVNNNEILWQIKASSNTISITSIKNVAMVDMDCAVWIKRQETGEMIMIGRIPDSGHNATIEFKLDGFKILPNDTVIVAMIDESYKDKKLPSKGQYPKSKFTKT